MNGGNGSLNTKLSVFDGKNWNQWSIQMRVLFGGQYVLDLVNDGYTSIAANATEAQRNVQHETKKKDQKALFYIHQCVDTTVFEKIDDVMTTKATWDTLVRSYEINGIMNPLDLEEFKRQGYMMIDFLTDYYKNIENYPVLSKVEPGYLAKKLPSSAPFQPESIESILEDVQQHIIPGLTHWMSPNYYAYFPCSGSIAGFAGEVLSNGFNVVGFNWLSSPAATELETIVMNWLGKMLNLPKCFIFSSNFQGGGGVLLGTTCEAILCTLVAARDEKLSKIGKENLGKLVVYCSDQTHSALQKAAQIVGIHAQNFRVIETKGSDFFALSHESFLSTILLDVENGLVPCFLCATIGTTGTNAIDPIKLLCNVAKEYDIWVHVDAAYAGSSCICPEYRHYIDGIEDANSFSFNAHKWFLTNLACCCLWVKDHSALTKSLSTYPEFLRNINSDSKEVIDYKDWQIPLSRKFNSLKLWIVIRSYGVENLKKFLRNHVEMAKTFEGLVRKDERFEIVVPTRFALVCFRISPSTINITNGSREGCYNNIGKMINEVNQKLLDSINGSGKACMSHCEVDGAFVIRCAIGSTLTEEHHVIMTWKLVQKHATFLLGKRLDLGNKQACDTQTE